ncbi:MAG: GGDEF domain-containing protein [Acetivibrionales bacterium]|jgi:diguanylate cyclase (GGDEF)-like protein
MSNIRKRVNANKIFSAKSKKKIISLIGFRWLLVVFTVLFSISKPEGVPIGRLLPYILSCVFIYNIFLTYNSLKDRQSSIVISSPVLFIDAVLICLLSSQIGGIESDIFIMLFIIIAYCGTVYNPARTLILSAFCIIIYSASCIYAANAASQQINYLRLAIRVFFLAFDTFGICIISNEIRKYNDLVIKEFKIARTDKLTGLANRHYFDHRIKEETHYADSTGSVLNIMMLDLDNFKMFNDSYGHVYGDKLLVLFSDIIRQNIRKSDMAVRFGGEEFLILIRDLDIVIAKSIADRIRRQLEKKSLYTGEKEDKNKVTVSCGIAQYPKHAKAIKQVIECADKALYHAKKNGKNIVVIYEESMKEKALD